MNKHEVVSELLDMIYLQLDYIKRLKDVNITLDILENFKLVDLLNKVSGKYTYSIPFDYYFHVITKEEALTMILSDKTSEKEMYELIGRKNHINYDDIEWIQELEEV
ncbi:hypothetical protein ACTWQB_02000 [Piscibacillus sp. B03]|uniref:hypothetical protein n=1 Tax=Piscibacillus sp. B03 TaxID=3457430 RepID=UPI003FCD0201